MADIQSIDIVVLEIYRCYSQINIWFADHFQLSQANINKIRLLRYLSQTLKDLCQLLINLQNETDIFTFRQIRKLIQIGLDIEPIADVIIEHINQMNEEGYLTEERNEVINNHVEELLNYLDQNTLENVLSEGLAIEVSP